MILNNKPWIIFIVGILAGLALALAIPKLRPHGRMSAAPEAASAKKRPLYQCPMHPSIVSNKPENCSVCGMRLQKMEVEQAGRGPILYYKHPMRPDITSPKPAKDEMGMDYIPVYEGEEEEVEAPVSGHAVVKLPRWRRQLIGITTTAASRRPLHVAIRTVGRIAYDPDLFTAMTEYREALITREKVKDSPWPDIHERAGAMVRAAGLKLKLMGLSEDQVGKIAVEGAPTNLLVGQAGGTLWVYAEIYENEVGLVSQGQTAEVTLQALPGKVIHATIRAIDPVLNPNTRSVRVRAEIPNTQGILRPEMFVNVLIKVPLGLQLSVPTDAVFDTGTRQLVFVEVAEGEFEPREIKVGRRTENHYEILSGLNEGEAVLTQANFLMDSESRLRATGAKASQSATRPMKNIPEGKPQ